MHLEITHINRDKGIRYNSYSCPLEPEDLNGLFRHLSREFGRCLSKIYAGEGTPVGWVFEKKQYYTDKGYYMQETWVTINED